MTPLAGNDFTSGRFDPLQQKDISYDANAVGYSTSICHLSEGILDSKRGFSGRLRHDSVEESKERLLIMSQLAMCGSRFLIRIMSKCLARYLLTL